MLLTHPPTNILPFVLTTGTPGRVGSAICTVGGGLGVVVDCDIVDVCILVVGTNAAVGGVFGLITNDGVLTGGFQYLSFSHMKFRFKSQLSSFSSLFQKSPQCSPYPPLSGWPFFHGNIFVSRAFPSVHL